MEDKDFSTRDTVTVLSFNRLEPLKKGQSLGQPVLSLVERSSLSWRSNNVGIETTSIQVIGAKVYQFQRLTVFSQVGLSTYFLIFDWFRGFCLEETNYSVPAINKQSINCPTI